jgi:hypothetical protein
MVKLSKAPSGVMFMQGKIDNVMGQLYHITFDLEFTTINDWAALGEYNEQSNVYDNGKLTINNSIYNNPYYCPSILLTKDKEQSKVLNAAEYIFGSDRLGIKIDNMPSDTVLFYIYDYSGLQIGYCKIEEEALRHYHLYNTSNGPET